MQVEVSDSGHEVRIRNGGGCRAVLSVVPLVLGLLALAAVVVGVVNGPRTWWGVFFGGTLGLLFTSIGLMEVFFRWGVVVDFPGNVLHSWWRLLWFRRETTYRLDQFQSLCMTRYWNRSRHGRPWLYRIVLRPVNPKEKSLELGSELGEHQARPNLQRLAELLKLPAMEEEEQKTGART